MNGLLTLAAVLGLAAQCAPEVEPHLIAGIVLHESGGNPTATHKNTNGTTDYGLMQVNESNFSWLGITAQTVLDPCTNIHAGARVLMAGLSRYASGNPRDGIANGYARDVLTLAARTIGAPTQPSPVATAVPRPATTLASQFASFSATQK